MWYDYDQMPPMDEEAYHRLLDTFLPSEEMREYLKKEPMLPDSIILDLIIGAPVPLSEKIKWASRAVCLLFIRASSIGIKT